MRSRRLPCGRESLAIDAAGDLFGTTVNGGSGSGTVFEIAITSGSASAPGYGNTPTTLYSFTGIDSDGANPEAGLIFDAAGDLLGTTLYGGASGNGSVFEIANTSGSASAPAYAGTETTLVSLAGPSDGGLIADAAGNLYGTIVSGGASGNGTLFEIANTSGSASAPVYANTATPLVSFGGDSPEAGLIAIAGGLSGTTASGGTGGNGTVFETIPAGIAPVPIAAEAPTLTTAIGTPSNGGTLELRQRGLSGGARAAGRSERLAELGQCAGQRDIARDRRTGYRRIRGIRIQRDDPRADDVRQRALRRRAGPQRRRQRSGAQGWVGALTTARSEPRRGICVPATIDIRSAGTRTLSWKTPLEREVGPGILRAIG